MNIVGALVVFVVVWWLVFFTVLPWGIVSQVEDEDVEPGTEPGAPARRATRRALERGPTAIR